MSIHVIVERQLDENHIYAVGLLVENGTCSPLRSYNTPEEVKKGFAEFYRFASERKLSKPIALQKLNKEESWKDATCLVLKDLMKQTVKEKGLDSHLNN